MKEYKKANYHTHTYRCNHAVGEDEEYVLKAIENNPEALEFASERLKCDREVVYNSVSKARMDLLLYWNRIIKR